MTARLRLGDLLVASNVVTEAQVAEALAKQKETGRRLGETLVALGYVTELQVAQTLSHQLSVPWANLQRVDFSRELLNLVSADVAVSARVVPIYVRRVRQQGEVLFVATDDPLNEQALLTVAAHVGMPVKAMVASALDLRNALRVYYGRVVEAPAPLPGNEDEELEIEVDVPVSVVHSLRPATRASPSPEPEPEPGSEAAPIPATRVKPRARDAQEERAPTPTPAERPVEPASGAQAEPPAQTTPRPRKKRGAPSKPRMLTLTLLDGTQVKLPTPTQGASTDAETHEHLTSRDLIQALLLHAEGKDVSQVLPEAHWQTLFATLLSLLLKKGLVADWDFVEEWTSLRRSRGVG